MHPPESDSAAERWDETLDDSVAPGGGPVERRQGERRAPAGRGRTKNRRRVTGDELRQAILDEARRVIVTSGVHELSTRRVADAVGCTATSIYIYFQSKDALLHAVIDEGMQALHAALETAAASTPDPRARVAAMAEAYLGFGFENASLYEVMFSLHPRQMERYPAESYRRARRNIEAFRDALGNVQAASEHDAGDRRMAGAPSSAMNLAHATTIWSALHGHVALWSAGRVDASIPRETFIDGALALIRQSLQ